MSERKKKTSAGGREGAPRVLVAYEYDAMTHILKTQLIAANSLNEIEGVVHQQFTKRHITRH